MKYTVEKLAGTGRTMYTYAERNARGETIQVELSACYPDNTSRHSTARIWRKAGFTARVLPSYWYVTVYVTDAAGFCWGKYDPMTKPSEDGKRQVLNFDWVLEATEENREKLLAEVERLAFAETAKGVSAA